MLGKSLSPVIGKFSGKAAGTPIIDGSTSPRSPFELKSPRGPKSFNLGAVGLAIVAALDKSCSNQDEFPACRAVYNRNSNPAIPIPVNSCRNSAGDSYETDAESDDEEYTLVTCRGPDNESLTRFYCDRGVVGSHISPIFSRPSVFMISPASTGESPGYPDSDFLNSCHMCHKTLHGKDIYIYRGEKAFCSTDCRYREIVIDEYNEKKFISEISRSVDVSSSPCCEGKTFSTGIFAL